MAPLHSPGCHVWQVRMDLLYAKSYIMDQMPEAYERLLLEALVNDHSHFVSEEVTDDDRTSPPLVPLPRSPALVPLPRSPALTPPPRSPSLVHSVIVWQELREQWRIFTPVRAHPPPPHTTAHALIIITP